MDSGSIEARLERLEARLAALEGRPDAPRAPEPARRPIEYRPPAPSAPSAPVDWEALAGVWFNRVGLLALLLGVSFFLKYAFEQRWLDERARVVLGLLAGGALVGMGDRLARAGTRAYGLSLVGGGLSILYLSLYGAFGYYHLIAQGTAFAAMSMVTAAACALALRQDALPVAAVGLLGGFLTPSLLSTGTVDLHGLFGYLSILSVGLAGVAYAKGWRLLSLGALAGTQFYLQGFIGTPACGPEQLGWTLYYAASYWLLFVTLSVGPHLRSGEPSRDEDAALAVLAAAGSYWAVHRLLSPAHHASLGPLTFALAGVYGALAWTVVRKPDGDRRLALLHVGLAAVFTAVAASLQFDRAWITVAWAVEAAALFAAGFRLGDPPVRFMGAGALLAALLRALTVDSQLAPPHAFLFNERGLAYAAVFAAVIVCVNGYGELREPHPQEKDFRSFFGVCGVLLGLWLLSLEGREFWQSLSPESRLAWFGSAADAYRRQRIAQSFSLSAVWGLYGAAWFAYGAWRSRRPVRLLALAILAATIAKVFLSDLSFLNAVWRILSFIGLGLLTLAVSYYYQRARASDASP